MSPKQIIFSVLFAGAVVNSYRTVSINSPGLLSCAISFGKEEGFRVKKYAFYDLSSSQVFFVRSNTKKKYGTGGRAFLNLHE